MRIRVEQVMTEPAEMMEPSSPAALAAETMKRNRIHHVVAVENGKPVGIVSSGDLRSRDLASLTVADVMTADPEVVGPKATMQEVANRMRGRSIGCLPVFDGKHVVGIVTVADLLELIGKGLQKPIVRGKRWTLTHPVRGARTTRNLRRSG